MPGFGFFSYAEIIPENDAFYLSFDFANSYLDSSKYPALRNWPYQKYPAVCMLTAALLAFANEGYCSVRQFENRCRFDVRFHCLFNQKIPSYKTFQNFLNNAFFPYYKEIFTEFNNYITSLDNPDTSLLLVDGTKFGANANKFSFVWIKNTKRYVIQIWEKVIKYVIDLNLYLLKNDYSKKFSILSPPDLELPYSIRQYLKNLIVSGKIDFVYGTGRKKHPLQKFYEQADQFCQSITKYHEQLQIAQERNSYSKTDPDATFMHMKYDYYCNTGVFKPGYNVQVGVSDYYIRVIEVSQHANDTADFIPLLERYKEGYGEYPQACGADAGYGSLESYRFCDRNQIVPYMKYNTYQKEIKGSKSDRFKSYSLARTVDGRPICPAGHQMELSERYQSCKTGVSREIEKYVTPHCQNCPDRKECTKSPKGRTVMIVPELDLYKAAVKNLLAADSGKEVLGKRSSQAEGTFGTIKQDYEFDRFHRRGFERIEFEIYLVAFGHNLRHLQKKMRLKNEADECHEDEEAVSEQLNENMGEDDFSAEEPTEFDQGVLDLEI